MEFTTCKKCGHRLIDGAHANPSFCWVEKMSEMKIELKEAKSEIATLKGKKILNPYGFPMMGDYNV